MNFISIIIKDTSVTINRVTREPDTTLRIVPIIKIIITADAISPMIN